MAILNLSEIEKRQAYDKLKKFEDAIWKDVFRARRSLAIIEIFLADIGKSCSRRRLEKSAPIINALYGAASESLIISLGRLLNVSKKRSECNLARYMSKAIAYVSRYGPVRSESKYARESLGKLKDSVKVEALKSQLEDYRKQILPWRNKVTAHTQVSATPIFPKCLPDSIAFIESIHALCHSAVDDAGGPGLYSTEEFKKSSDLWVAILKEENRKPDPAD